MLALREETAVLAVVGFIVWAFHRLKKPKSREMSAREVQADNFELVRILGPKVMEER